MLKESEWGFNFLCECSKDDELLFVFVGAPSLLETEPPRTQLTSLAPFWNFEMHVILYEIGEKDLGVHRRRYGYQEYQVLEKSTYMSSHYPGEEILYNLSDEFSQRLGLIDEGKLDSFNVPYYNPSQNEVQCLVDKEGYLTTEFIDTIALDIGRAQTQELKATDA
ncbi:Uncharacterized protein TCM_042577 [Theobroma cacao]|uniref:Uncharacterized protein n=1 Tax=Theobroma cacao TaxID=3641 RepID=A0A061FLT4_THECC|nr:Uncharacterized protein TCM_042577 [Theobroma cacao]